MRTGAIMEYLDSQLAPSRLYRILYNYPASYTLREHPQRPVTLPGTEESMANGPAKDSKSARPMDPQFQCPRSVSDSRPMDLHANARTALLLPKADGPTGRGFPKADGPNGKSILASPRPSQRTRRGGKERSR